MDVLSRIEVLKRCSKRYVNVVVRIRNAGDLGYKMTQLLAHKVGSSQAFLG